MQKIIGSGVGAFILVAAFVWIVFDNLALGLIFGLMAAAGASKAVSISTPVDHQKSSAAATRPDHDGI